MVGQMYLSTSPPFSQMAFAPWKRATALSSRSSKARRACRRLASIRSNLSHRTAVKGAGLMIRPFRSRSLPPHHRSINPNSLKNLKSEIIHSQAYRLFHILENLRVAYRDPLPTVKPQRIDCAVDVFRMPL